eukprot:scaffold76447_cov16-Tisochrysis_lutea.AAC.2
MASWKRSCRNLSPERLESLIPRTHHECGQAGAGGPGLCCMVSVNQLNCTSVRVTPYHGRAYRANCAVVPFPSELPQAIKQSRGSMCTENG